MPEISVIIPAYNAAHTLPATLASLQAQHFADWEAIVVDDGSTDDTRAIVDEAALSDARITFARNLGKGPSAARNHGAIDLARGRIVAFCDADDIWTPDKLSIVHAAMASDLRDAVFGQIAFFRTTPADARTRSTVPAGHLTLKMLMGENPVCSLSNLSVRRDAYIASGGFDEGLVHNEDLEWLIRFVGSGALVSGIDQLMVYYRTNPGGLSSDLRAMARGRKAALATAARFGFAPDPQSEAVYMRYLARRALRLDHGRLSALGYALRGLTLSPRGFCQPARRGVATALGALAAPVLPRSLRHALFAG